MRARRHLVTQHDDRHCSSASLERAVTTLGRRSALADRKDGREEWVRAPGPPAFPRLPPPSFIEPCSFTLLSQSFESLPLMLFLELTVEVVEALCGHSQPELSKARTPNGCEASLPSRASEERAARASSFDVRSGQDANAKALGDGLAQKAFADGLASLFQVAHCTPFYVPGSQPTS